MPCAISSTGGRTTRSAYQPGHIWSGLTTMRRPETDVTQERGNTCA